MYFHIFQSIHHELDMKAYQSTVNYRVEIN